MMPTVFGARNASARTAATSSRSDRLQVRGLLRLADQPARVIAARGQHPEQPQGDLAVSADDEDVHAPTVPAEPRVQDKPAIVDARVCPGASQPWFVSRTRREMGP
jgi:hypothetical protein